jgi:hypothetical protein
MLRYPTPADPLRAAIVAAYGPSAKIEKVSPGVISVTTDVIADPRIIADSTPWGMVVLVNGKPLGPITPPFADLIPPTTAAPSPADQLG